MAKAHFSVSFRLECDEKTIPQIAHRLDQRLTAKIKDLLAQALHDLEFDLQERYCLFSPEAKPNSAAKRAKGMPTIPIWSPDKQTFRQIQIGSADWFALIENEGKFYYHYQDLRFTVRFETRQSKGKSYSYWRAYATINRKLVTKQLGRTEVLTKEALDAVGAYFLATSQENRAGKQGGA